MTRGLQQVLSSNGTIDIHAHLNFTSGYSRYHGAPRMSINESYGIFIAVGETTWTYVLKLYEINPYHTMVTWLSFVLTGIFKRWI